jgi:hypothetical protein
MSRPHLQLVQSAPAPLRAIDVISRPNFMFRVNFHLDAGRSMMETIDLIRPIVEVEFKEVAGRTLRVEDIMAARSLYMSLFPNKALRFSLSMWTLTLSKTFFDGVMEVSKRPEIDHHPYIVNGPQWADGTNELFQPYISSRVYRTTSDGSLPVIFNGRVTPEDIASSLALHSPSYVRGSEIMSFEAGVFHWARQNHFGFDQLGLQQHMEAIGLYGVYQGFVKWLGEVVERDYFGSHTADHKSKTHSQRQYELLEGIVQYLRWLTLHNPLDTSP